MPFPLTRRGSLSLKGATTSGDVVETIADALKTARVIVSRKSADRIAFTTPFLIRSKIDPVSSGSVAVSASGDDGVTVSWTISFSALGLQALIPTIVLAMVLAPLTAGAPLLIAPLIWLFLTGLGWLAGGSTFRRLITNATRSPSPESPHAPADRTTRASRDPIRSSSADSA